MNDQYFPWIMGGLLIFLFVVAIVCEVCRYEPNPVIYEWPDDADQDAKQFAEGFQAGSKDGCPGPEAFWAGGDSFQAGFEAGRKQLAMRKT